MRNLIVYVSDALRTDHVGCYGARRVNTRTIDELAATGARFDDAIAPAPWTCPSTTSMISGLYPHHHGYLHWDAPLDPAIPTLFTVAAANGYETGSFVFDEDFLFKGFPDANVAGTSESLDGAVAWLREHRDRPFVLWFHSWTTHMPYDVLHAERKDWLAAKQQIMSGIQSDSAVALEELREAYAQSVERSSEVFLAGFLEELDSLGLRETTALAFVADHGESWGERFTDKQQVKGTYHMHGARLDEEIVQVPFLLSAPGAVEPGVVVPQQVSLVDLTPTLLDLGGAPLEGVDGRSLLPLLAGEDPEPDRDAWVVGTDAGRVSQLCLRRPPWKLLVHVESGEEEAYRLDTDPRERRSVPDDVPAELRERLYAELAAVEQPEVSADDAAKVESRLADLGYL
ncbi:MAG TPA: sulfatase [Gaiellaceae bacterium]|nr:sulfatase [Gaiellaceae bacterium]